jgi:hypothetical protein
MKFQKEFEKNMIWGKLAMAVCIVFIAGFYFHAVQLEFNNLCSGCVTSECMDNDIVCGDFGIYYFKFFSLIGLSCSSILLIIPASRRL